MNNLKHPFLLLQGIADGLKAELDREPNRRLGDLEVSFHTESEEFTFGVPEALNAISNDLYWDERGNWSEARLAQVTVI